MKAVACIWVAGGLMLASMSGLAPADARVAGGRIGWIHGLPGDSSANGIRLELTDVVPPRPATTSMKLRFRKDDRLRQLLGRVASRRDRIARLSLVVRNDPTSTRVVIYRLAGAVVDSVATEDSTEAVVVSYDRSVTVSALTGNPGPPASAPPIRPRVPNKAWLYGVSESRARKLVELDVRGYVPPGLSGSVTVRLAGTELPAALESLGSGRGCPSPLAIVLPDSRRGRYVEYKLWNPTIAWARHAGSLEVTLESRTIEAMMNGTPLE